MGQAFKKPGKGDGSDTQKELLDAQLTKLINEKYDVLLKNVTTADELYHALFEIVEELSKQKGAMEFKLPTKGELDGAFKKYHGNRMSVMTRDEFRFIIKEVVKFDSFSIGQGARDAILSIFAAPMLALLAKRFVPGMGSISDDVVIPVATSGAVLLLAKTNKL